MILLFSGGLDSYIAWHYLHKPKTLYVDLGHRYAAHEVEVVKRLVPDTIIDTRLNLADQEEKDANIPLRNVYLTMIASHYDDDIILVVQKGEMDIPDRSVRFFNEFSVFLSAMLKKTKTLTTPFFLMTKTAMVTWYLNVGLDPNILLSTRSCYSPGELPCGNCSACFRRWVAFINNDMSEEYESDITKYSENTNYLDRLRAGHYDPVRTKETLNALKKAGIG